MQGISLVLQVIACVGIEPVTARDDFRERIVAQVATSTAEIEARNANFVGGDILTGANTPWQTAIRPRLAPVPSWTGARGLFICSAATPPGPGAHGICGYNAAESVLRTF